MFGCELERPQEGELLDVDVEGGKLPELEVRGPYIEVGTTAAKINVPAGVNVDVETEEKTFTAPDIDIELPEEVDRGEWLTGNFRRLRW